MSDTTEVDLSLDKALELLLQQPQRLAERPPDFVTAMSQEFLPGTLPIYSEASKDYLRGRLDAYYEYLFNVRNLLSSQVFPENEQGRRTLGILKRRIIQAAVTRIEIELHNRGYHYRDLYPDWPGAASKRMEREPKLAPGQMISAKAKA